MIARVLEPRGLGDAERSQARSYQPGDVVAFREGNRDEGVRRRIPYQVQGVDAPAGIVRLLDPAKGKAVDWQPARWGSDVAEAFTKTEQESAPATRCSSPATTRAAAASTATPPASSRSIRRAAA